MTLRLPTDIPISAEETVSLPTGVHLTYQIFGRSEDPAMLLIMGLGGPMTWWHPDLCLMLAAAGYRVIRFDNRDTGRSTKLTDHRVRRSDVVAAFSGRRKRAPYTLDDMAADGFALLDHLGIERAHLVGVSMGGMIAQTMTVLDPQRVLTLTSIMSTIGRRTVGWQHPRLLAMLWGPRRRDRDAYVRMSSRTWKVIGSPNFPTSSEERRRRAGETWDRGYSASGVLRQTMAVLCQPDRTAALKALDVPTLVIHGRQDPLVHVSGGRATASALRGSSLMLIDGMAHDLPEQLHSTIAGAIAGHAGRAR